jgi:hypothetical protein
MMEWIGEFLYHISPALIIVGIGACVVQRSFIKRANEASLIDHIVNELKQLEVVAVEYWNIPSGKKAEEKRSIELLAQRIKSSVKSIGSDVMIYCVKYCSKKTTEFQILVDGLCEACTGGDFESQKKTVDCGRYLKVSNAINRLKSDLIRRKL